MLTIQLRSHTLYGLEVDECHPHVRASMPHDRTKTMHPKPAPSRSHLQLVKRSAVERANGKVTAPWLLPTWQAARALSPLRGTSSQPLLSSAKNRLAPMLTPEDLARARRRIANASNDASSPPTKDASEDLRGALRTIALSAIASAGSAPAELDQFSEALALYADVSETGLGDDELKSLKLAVTEAREAARLSVQQRSEADKARRSEQAFISEAAGFLDGEGSRGSFVRGTSCPLSVSSGDSAAGRNAACTVNEAGSRQIETMAASKSVPDTQESVGRVTPMPTVGPASEMVAKIEAAAAADLAVINQRGFAPSTSHGDALRDTFAPATGCVPRAWHSRWSSGGEATDLAAHQATPSAIDSMQSIRIQPSAPLVSASISVRLPHVATESSLVPPTHRNSSSAHWPGHTSAGSLRLSERTGLRADLSERTDLKTAPIPHYQLPLGGVRQRPRSALPIDLPARACGEGAAPIMSRACTTGIGCGQTDREKIDCSSGDAERSLGTSAGKANQETPHQVEGRDGAMPDENDGSCPWNATSDACQGSGTKDGVSTRPLNAIRVNRCPVPYPMGRESMRSLGVTDSKEWHAAGRVHTALRRARSNGPPVPVRAASICFHVADAVGTSLTPQESPRPLDANTAAPASASLVASRFGAVASESPAPAHSIHCNAAICSHTHLSGIEPPRCLAEAAVRDLGSVGSIDEVGAWSTASPPPPHTSNASSQAGAESDADPPADELVSWIDMGESDDGNGGALHMDNAGASKDRRQREALLWNQVRDLASAADPYFVAYTPATAESRLDVAESCRSAGVLDVAPLVKLGTDQRQEALPSPSLSAHSDDDAKSVPGAFAALAPCHMAISSSAACIAPHARLAVPSNAQAIASAPGRILPEEDMLTAVLQQQARGEKREHPTCVLLQPTSPSESDSVLRAAQPSLLQYDQHDEHDEDRVQLRASLNALAATAAEAAAAARVSAATADLAARAAIASVSQTRRLLGTVLQPPAELTLSNSLRLSIGAVLVDKLLSHEKSLGLAPSSLLAKAVPEDPVSNVRSTCVLTSAPSVSGMVASPSTSPISRKPAKEAVKAITPKYGRRTTTYRRAAGTSLPSKKSDYPEARLLDESIQASRIPSAPRSSPRLHLLEPVLVPPLMVTPSTTAPQGSGDPDLADGNNKSTIDEETAEELQRCLDQLMHTQEPHQSDGEGAVRKEPSQSMEEIWKIEELPACDHDTVPLSHEPPLGRLITPRAVPPPATSAVLHHPTTRAMATAGGVPAPHRMAHYQQHRRSKQFDPSQRAGHVARLAHLRAEIQT